MSDNVIIVDPYSSGAMLAPLFRERGLTPVAVLSEDPPPAVYAPSFVPQDHDSVLVSGAGGALQLDTVKRLDPVGVLPGTECGVELADELAVALTPHLANVPERSTARRHKAAMQEALAAAGLRHVRQVCTDEPGEVHDWVAREGLSGKPLVVKPPKSAGTDSVLKIPAGVDWLPAFGSLLHRPNKLNQVNDRVLVQEMLVGDEYVVDTVSWDGRHTVTDVCRYDKTDNGPHMAVYDSMEFRDVDEPEHPELLDYTFAAIDALGIRYGAAHSEVMLTADGPVLIETGARMHGGGHPEYCRLATGDSQLDRLVTCYARAGTIPARYRLERAVTVVFLVAASAGVVSNVEVLAAAADLPSHYRSVVSVQSGQPVAATSDLFTALGFIVLAHDDPEQVRRDRDAVKRLQTRLDIMS